jgi:hypothetical protein
MHGPLNVKEAETRLLMPNPWRTMIMKHACHFRIIRTRNLKVFLKVKLFLSARERREWRGGMTPLKFNFDIRRVITFTPQQLCALYPFNGKLPGRQVQSARGLDNRKTRLAVAEKPTAISVFQLGERIRIYIVHKSRFVTFDTGCVIKR